MMGFRFSFLYLLLLALTKSGGRTVQHPTSSNVLKSFQVDFLKMLNLSEVPQDPRWVQPPPVMMELYNTYATKTLLIPRSDVIRSFVIQDATYSISSALKMKFRLFFKFSVPAHEVITGVALQLLTLSDHHSVCKNVLTSITISNVIHIRNHEIIQLLDRKEVGGAEHSWETFDVMAGVQKWHGAGVLQLEVDDNTCGRNISLNIKENTSPFLIVFSDDLGKKKEKFIMYQKEKDFLSKNLPETVSKHLQMNVHPRIKRSPRKNFCHRTSMKVNFKDIGWDKWIVAPSEYEAYECRGVCSFPLTEKFTPSKHAIIQTLVNLRNPKKVNKACCVPTKLDPLTVMYQENGVITVRHLYEEMKVAKCGCR